MEDATIDPEKIIMVRIVGAELTNNTNWFYSMEGKNLSQHETHHKYEEDIYDLLT